MLNLLVNAKHLAQYLQLKALHLLESLLKVIDVRLNLFREKFSDLENNDVDILI
jgi:hypothetical protein